MNRLNDIVREPALIVEILTSLLFLVVAFWPGLVNGDQQSYIVALIVALGGVVKAILTKPFAVTALTDFLRAALIVAASFGVAISADQIAIVVATVGLLITSVVRGQITPRYDPVVKVGGAGSGPVAGESGAANIFYAAGVALVLLSLILLVLTLLEAVAVSFVVIAVLFVIGVALIIWAGYSGRAGHPL